MPDPKGSRLFVNLGPSQARRRLKGFGHGVRKVQTAGRNRAVIIHTATGRHLEELMAKFTDVGFSSTEMELNPPTGSPASLGAERQNALIPESETDGKLQADDEGKPALH
jgi:DNA transformation protein